MNIAWLTDIHLNFLDEEARYRFYQEIDASQCDAVIISGDIAEAPTVTSLLTEMVGHLKRDIYFVLGNHDYYLGQIDNVREEMLQLMKDEKQLHWLPNSAVQISAATAIVGQDGWADGRYGDYANSRVSLNDSRLIADLFQAKCMGKYPLLDKMQTLADTDAVALENNIHHMLTGTTVSEVIVVTHVPPFDEASLFEGKKSSDDFLPFFSCKAIGDVLLNVAEQYQNCHFTVLCGHTHEAAEYQAKDNLVVRVGGAVYQQPEMQGIITFV